MLAIVITICVTVVIVTLITCIYSYLTNEKVLELKKNEEYYRGRCHAFRLELHDILFCKDETQKKLEALRSLYMDLE